MSLSALELLRSLDLIDASDHATDLSRFSDQELRTVLTSYRTARQTSIVEEVKAEAACAPALASVRSSVSSVNEVAPILTSALVYGRTFTDDPICRVAHVPNDHAKATNASLGLKTSTGPDRNQVARAIAHVAALAPLIRSQVTCVLPIGLLHQSSEELPVFFSPDGFASEVPEHVRAYVAESAVVRELVPSPEHGGLLILDEAPKRPTRGISVRFAGDEDSNDGMLYLLYRLVKAERLGDGRLRIAQKLDWEDRPDEGQYHFWVRQSINKTVLIRLAAVSAEMVLADALGATYLTESAFEARLLALSTEGGLPPDSRALAVNFLQANAPFLDFGSPEVVARLRRDNSGLFEKFQSSLLHVASQLKGVDEVAFTDKARQLYVKEIEPQVQAIDAQLSKVRYQSAASLILSAAAIGLALLKVPGVPFGVMLTLAGGVAALQSIGGTLPTVGEYLQKKRGPSYIWSQIAK